MSMNGNGIALRLYWELNNELISHIVLLHVACIGNFNMIQSDLVWNLGSEKIN